MQSRQSNILSICLLSCACLFVLSDYRFSRKKNSFDQLKSDFLEGNISDLKQDMETSAFHNFMDAPAVLTSASGQADINESQKDTKNKRLKNSSLNATEVKLHEKTVQISKGDTIVTLLSNVGFSVLDAEIIASFVLKNVQKKYLLPGRTLVLRYKALQENLPIDLSELEIPLQGRKVFYVRKNEAGEYLTETVSLEIKTVVRRAYGRVRSSFYHAAIQSGIPQKIVKEAISALTYVMNFQHGIKRGDQFEILYEIEQDPRIKSEMVKNIKYIGFMAGNNYHRIYRMNLNGSHHFVDAKGVSIVRGLLQNPIDPKKMRITSGFCKNRLHPIKGYHRDHKGVDFGAPTGTEIKAAGSGVVVRLGYYGEYGNYIKIRHGGGYETVYAHLSRYAKGLTVGQRVQQDQVIGYVGSTGNATGPHLHFEVIRNGSHVNPMSVKVMPTTKLSGQDLKKFYTFKKNLETHLVGLTSVKDLQSKVIG